MKIQKFSLAVLFIAMQQLHAAAVTTPLDESEGSQQLSQQQIVQPISNTPEAIEPIDLTVNKKKKSQNVNISSGNSLDDLMNPASKATTGVTDIRSEMIETAAQTVGFQNGLADAAKQLIEQLNTRQSRLDNIFQFNTLVQKNGVLPPVIVEANDLSAFSDDQIRTADKVYKIIKTERFVSVPPSWKDYLYVGLINQPGEVIGVKPENSAELKLWRKAVQKGWKQGQLQAGEILKENFNRLNRDFTGMMLYSTLRQQHMIDSTTVGESITTLNGTKDQLMIGDKHKRILKKASFNTNPAQWKPVLNRSSDLDEGKVTDPSLLDKKVFNKK